VLIVEDQDIVRRGLATLLELDDRVEVVGEAADGAEALREISRSRPEVALVDVRMPRMDGVELTGRLATDHPGVAVIILTTFDDEEYVFGGLRAGAKGYLLKNVSTGGARAGHREGEHGRVGVRRAGRCEGDLRA
jgi:DNA-binding NarL/FixJ family response regulator